MLDRRLGLCPLLVLDAIVSLDMAPSVEAPRRRGGRLAAFQLLRRRCGRAMEGLGPRATVLVLRAHGCRMRARRATRLAPSLACASAEGACNRNAATGSSPAVGAPADAASSSTGGWDLQHCSGIASSTGTEDFSEEQRGRCCKLAGIGCDALAAISEALSDTARENSASEAFKLCRGGAGLAGLSAEQRLWCCETDGVGCESFPGAEEAAPPPPPAMPPTTTRTTTTARSTVSLQLPQHARVLAMFKHRMGQRYDSANDTMAALDVDRSGDLNADEFVDGVLRHRLLDTRDHAAFAFEHFDVDHDEHVGPLEFYGTLNNLPDWLLP